MNGWRLANLYEVSCPVVLPVPPLDQTPPPRHNRPHENDDFHLWEYYPLAFALVRPFSSLESLEDKRPGPVPVAACLADLGRFFQ